jgi:hypothetical protein
VNKNIFISVTIRGWVGKGLRAVPFVRFRPLLALSSQQ